MIASYETKYASRNIYLDLRKKELDKLRQPEADSGLMPLDARIDKYLDAVHEGKWRDPKQVQQMASLHVRPFYFYGSFISLTAGERHEFAENEVVNYYKCVIHDQNESLEQLKAEIDFLRDLSIEYRTAKEHLEQTLETRDRTIAELEETVKAKTAEGIKKVQMLNKQNAARLMEVVKLREQEKQIFEKELDLSERLRTKYHDEHKKMVEEVKDVKQVIEVPRLHYKHLDNLDYRSLRDQYDQYMTQQNFFREKTAVDRLKVRT